MQGRDFKCSFRLPLRGIVVPLVTPLRSQDALDVDGLFRLLGRVLSARVHAVFILGTTGEAQGLSYRLRRELIERVCGFVAGKVPVLVGITDTALVESVNLAQKARQAGADAVVAAAPYYFVPGQGELLDYFAELVDQVDLPLFLYNIPGRAKTVIEPETVKKAAGIARIVGLKDSSGDMTYLHQVKQLTSARPEFTLLVGPEELLAEAVLLGAHGGVNGGANMCPELYLELYDKAGARDYEAIEKLHQRVMEMSTKIYGVGKDGSSYLKGLKCALSLLGICDDLPARPLERFQDRERRIIERHLVQLGLLKAGRLAETSGATVRGASKVFT